MPWRGLVCGILIAFAGPGSALAADPVIGLWLTQPDRKNLTSHIEIRSCGSAFCGRAIAAFDSNRREVRTANVGRELFWGMEAHGDGQYLNGIVALPLVNVRAPATMRLTGRNLYVRACFLGKCVEQTWTRVK